MANEAPGRLHNHGCISPPPRRAFLYLPAGCVSSRDEMNRVEDMWEYTHATLLDVQPILMEALGDRGISELELERARDRAGMYRGQ